MAHNNLAPGLLLAAPRLGDPNFERTVVLLGRHETSGSLGWVINGRALPPVGQLLRESGVLPAGVDLSGESLALPARIGGPVSGNTGWLIYRREPGVALAGEMEVGPELGVTGDAGVFDDMAQGRAPKEFRLVLGYAGWGPGQLEGELKVGAWLPAAVDAALVFETAPDKLWDEAYKRTIGALPGAFTSTKRGSA